MKWLRPMTVSTVIYHLMVSHHCVGLLVSKLLSCYFDTDEVLLVRAELHIPAVAVFDYLSMFSFSTFM